MTPNQDNSENHQETPHENADVQRRLEEIDGSLLEKLPDDQRLQSGVPVEQRPSEVDFIQMTGLTRSTPGPSAPEAPPYPSEEDMDAARPVSFFEKGVADVDAAMAPGALEDTPGQEEGMPPQPPESPSIAGLKGIIADLTQEPPPGRPAEPAPAEREDAYAEAVFEAEGPEPAPQPEPSGGLVSQPTEPPDLVEAEQLLEALQDQPHEDYAVEEATPAPTPRPARAEPTPGAYPTEWPSDERVDQDDERDVSVYQKPLAAHRRQSKRRRSKRRRRMTRWAVRVAAVVVVACVLFAGYRWVEPRLVMPERAFAEAGALAARGKYREASIKYLDFVRLHPNHPKRPEAQFEAAFVLQLLEAKSFDEAQRIQQRSLGLFEQFVNDNPNHVRTIRAQSLMGLLNYRLGRYEEAVNLLRRPDLRLRDSAAALPALRTLARTYTQLSDYDAAESMYLQAASMPKNYNADVDYHELGDMFQKRAESAQNDEERIQFQRAAIGYWTHAMREPGIDPVNKARIREKHDWLLEELPEGESDALELSAAGGLVSFAEGAPARESENGAAPEHQADAGSAAPEESSTIEMEPNPAAEAEYLAETRPVPPE